MRSSRVGGEANRAAREPATCLDRIAAAASECVDDPDRVFKAMLTAKSSPELAAAFSKLGRGAVPFIGKHGAMR
jgi:hypothetical protein